MSSRSSSHLASSEMPSTQNSGQMDSEDPATLISTVPVEATDPRDSAHEATLTGIHDYECVIHHSHALQKWGVIRYGYLSCNIAIFVTTNSQEV